VAVLLLLPVLLLPVLLPPVVVLPVLLLLLLHTRGGRRSSPSRRAVRTRNEKFEV
jgi:hypothetical protein